jgi:16S rRNA (adenine1518-N6/adenine1519-N6)-dimethyltransferase
VAPHLFVPAPKVESAVAVIDRTSADPAAERAIEIAAGAFGQRRKMVRTSLRGVIADPDEALAAAGIDPAARAEDLSPTDYLRLAHA